MSVIEYDLMNPHRPRCEVLKVTRLLLLPESTGRLRLLAERYEGFVVGSAAEVLQRFTARDPSIADVVLNLSSGTLAAALTVLKANDHIAYKPVRGKNLRVGPKNDSRNPSQAPPLYKLDKNPDERERLDEI